MKCFKLVLDGTVKWTETSEERERLWNKTVSEYSTCGRKLSNIKLINVGLAGNCDAIKIMLAFIISLKSIEVCSGHWYAQPLMDSLESMENLETVSIKNTKFSGMKEVKVKCLKKLKHLKVTHKEMNFLQIFSQSQIISLEANFLYETLPGLEEERTRNLIKFLSLQRKLKSLKIRNVLDKELQDLRYCSGFKLKHLSVDLRTSFDSSEIECNLIKFLVVQSKSLKSLEINCKISLDLLRFILTEYKSLTNLTLNLRYFPYNMKLPFEIMQPSRKLKSISINQLP